MKSESGSLQSIIPKNKRIAFAACESMGAITVTEAGYVGEKHRG